MSALRERADGGDLVRVERGDLPRVAQSLRDGVRERGVERRCRASRSGRL